MSDSGEGAAGGTAAAEPKDQQDQPKFQSISELTGGKYESAEALWAAQQAATQKITELGQAKASPAQVVFDLNDAAQLAGLGADEISTALDGDGDLSEDQYKLLAEKGIDKDRAKSLIERHKKLAVADSLIEQQARARALERAAEALGEGKEGVDKFHENLRWAQANLTTEQIQSIRARLENPDTAVHAALELAGYRATRGATAPIVGGQRPGATSPQPFRSNEEKLKVMDDLRAEGINPFKDPGFMRRLRAGTEDTRTFSVGGR